MTGFEQFDICEWMDRILMRASHLAQPSKRRKKGIMKGKMVMAVAAVASAATMAFSFDSFAGATRYVIAHDRANEIFPGGRAIVEEISRLPVNWDGFGALAITPEVRSNALSALQAILPEVQQPEISPTVNGTIAFEWESPRGIAQLEIGVTRYSFFVARSDAEPVLMDGEAHGIRREIGRLVRNNLFLPQKEGARG